MSIKFLIMHMPIDSSLDHFVVIHQSLEHNLVEEECELLENLPFVTFYGIWLKDAWLQGILMSPTSQVK